MWRPEGMSKIAPSWIGITESKSLSLLLPAHGPSPQTCSPGMSPRHVPERSPSLCRLPVLAGHPCPWAGVGLDAGRGEASITPAVAREAQCRVPGWLELPFRGHQLHVSCTTTLLKMRGNEVCGSKDSLSSRHCAVDAGGSPCSCS